MRVLIDIGHPGHVHLFRNAYYKLLEKGHKVIVITKDVPIIIELLDFYRIKYIIIGSRRKSIISKIFGQLGYNFKSYVQIIKNKIDISIGSSFTIAQLSLISRMKSINFDDDDDVVEPLFVKYAHPFSDIVLSPNSISRKTHHNISYNGIHELAYLHPNQFTPDISVLKKVGLNIGETYFVLRFVALNGHHDVGHLGISLHQKRQIIALLLKKGKVFITSENRIEKEFEYLRLPVPPEEIHSLLYYSTMFLGDSQTMTSEAAILGVPALKCNTFAGRLSVPNELENKYGLCYAFHPRDFDKFLIKVRELIETPNLKVMWKEKLDNFLKDKIDVTNFMIWFIENYPESKKIMKENPNYQYRFK